jgi:hypothetical protein
MLGIFCQSCGQSVPLNMKVCPQCGSKNFADNPPVSSEKLPLKTGAASPNKATQQVTSPQLTSKKSANPVNLTHQKISISSIGRWVLYTGYASIASATFSIIGHFMEYNLLSAFEKGIYSSTSVISELAGSNDSRQLFLLVVMVLVQLVNGVVILRWIYLTNKRVSQLGASNMKFSPGWAVGWNFVPLFSLWKPYQAVKEIWKCSVNPGDRSMVKIPSALPLWWALWITFSVLNQITSKFSVKAEDLPELMLLDILYIISSIVLIPLSLVFINIVKRIEGNFQ